MINELAAHVKRRYDDACGTAHALELVGDRWALLVIRELMLGPRRFSQLRSALPGVSANVLTQRLQELEGRGLLTHEVLPPPASVPVYELTPWGYEAEPVVVALGRWAARSPWHDPTLPISAVSFMLSLRATFDLEGARTLSIAANLEVDHELFHLQVDRGALTLGRGSLERPEVTFAGTARQLAGALHAMTPWESLEQEGQATVRGDRRLARSLTRLFPLPAKANTAPPGSPKG